MIVWRVDPLRLLKMHGYSQSYLKKENIIAGGTIDALRTCSMNFSISTLDKICKLTDSRVEDLIEYVDD